MRTVKLAIIGLAACVSLAGCSSTQTATTEPKSGAESAVDRASEFARAEGPSSTTCDGLKQTAGETLRGSASYDFEPFETVGAAVSAVEVAIAGRIASWSPGRSIVDGGDATRYAVVKIEVDESFSVKSESVFYVSFDLGSESLNGDGSSILGEDGSSTVLTLEEAIAAAPVGTRVLFLGTESPTPTEEAYGEGVQVIDARAGLPDHATLYTAYPQGFLLETCDGAVTSALADEDEIDPWIVEAASRSKITHGNSAQSTGSFDLLLETARTDNS